MSRPVNVRLPAGTVEANLHPFAAGYSGIPGGEYVDAPDTARKNTSKQPLRITLHGCRFAYPVARMRLSGSWSTRALPSSLPPPSLSLSEMKMFWKSLPLSLFCILIWNVFFYLLKLCLQVPALRHNLQQGVFRQQDFGCDNEHCAVATQCPDAPVHSWQQCRQLQPGLHPQRSQ